MQNNRGYLSEIVRCSGEVANNSQSWSNSRFMLRSEQVENRWKDTGIFGDLNMAEGLDNFVNSIKIYLSGPSVK